MSVITSWSYSRYQAYKECPLAFKLKYLDKAGAGVSSPAMARGSEIHKLGELYVTTPDRPFTPHATAQPPALPPAYANFGEQMAQLWRLRASGAADVRVEQQLGFRDDWTPASASLRDLHGWFAKDTWLRVVWDVGVVYPDDTADLVDFKTGKRWATNDEQMELFGLSAFLKFPTLTKVTTRLWYLDIADGPDREGDEHPATTANEVVRDYYARDVSALKKVWEKKVAPMFKEQKYVPRPNAKCRFCTFSKASGGPCVY